MQTFCPAFRDRISNKSVWHRICRDERNIFSMDKILRTLYLRLDTTTNYLAKNAEEQLIVKIIYQTPNATFDELLVNYKMVVKNTTPQRLHELIDGLLERNEVAKQGKRYSLPKSKQKRIERALIESEERFYRIIETFKPYHSDTKSIETWLADVMICFFNAFSDDWMSDLCYNVNSVARRKDGIFDVIQKRTANNKGIDKRDRESLARKFIELILKKEPDVTEFLWEYGTAAFAAKLIRNAYTSDDLTVETFKDSCCILDTNILMHIGLESSEYYDSFKVLEEVFAELKIDVGVLYITQQEYNATIAYKREQVLRIVEQYDGMVLRETDDQYLRTAITRGCVTEDDFLTFFNQLSNIPNFIYERVKIRILDYDGTLEEEILSAQRNKNKVQDLNLLFKSITGHDKKENALLHDVGLISGADYLRKSGKYFILSQEVSVNTYAKKSPSANDLPMAIRIETLLNVLALNGNSKIISNDHKVLFADIIRENLQPSKDAFTIPDLSIMLEKNEQISKLPPEKVVSIAKDIHRERLLGASEEDLMMIMTRKIQGAKIEIVEDLSKTQQELSSERRDKEHFRMQAGKSESALRKRIEKEVRSEYCNQIILWWVKKIVILLLIPLLLFFLLPLTGLKEFVKELIFASLFGIGGWLFSKNKKMYEERERNKEENINKEVEFRLNKLLKEEE